MRIGTLHSLLCCLAILAVSPAVAQSGSAPPPAARNSSTTPTVNPHWQSRLCTTCHPGRPDGAVDGKRLVDADARANCDRCHTRAALARRLHHPYDLAASALIHVPGDWPQRNGSLSCLTCHDILRQCHLKPAERWRNPRFLRAEPEATAVEFCLQCHPKELYLTASPHDMLDEQGHERKGVCLTCHKTRPDTTATTTAWATISVTNLRSNIVDLCGNCHGTFAHPIGIPHLVPAPPEMRRRMAAFDLLDQYVIGLEQLQKYMAGRDRVPLFLPLIPGSYVITCVTCHNPHERGVLPPDLPLARGAEGETVRNYRLRLPHDQLCTACHQM